MTMHLYTLVFSPTTTMLLKVYGDLSDEQALAIACNAVPDAEYDVREGDWSNGKSFCVDSWHEQHVA